MLRAVIFDMDGVLVDSQGAHFEAFREFAREQGVEAHDTLLRRTFGMHNNEIMPMLLGRQLSREETARLAGRKEEIFRSRARGSLRPIPGAKALVRALHADGIRLAVGSSGPRANVELALQELGIANLFRAVISGDDVRRAKPHPYVFQLAAVILDVAPAECVVIEDAPMGVTAALAAGMRVLAVGTSRPLGELHEAHRVVPSLEGVDVAQLRALVPAGNP